MDDPQDIKKIVLVGDPRVGKTSLRKRYLGKGFSSNYMATIGADFSFTNYEGTKFSIWDIAGEKNYGSIRSQFYSGASGVIVVFDIARPETFYNIDHWIAEIQATMIEKIPFILVGNKDDLRKIERNLVSEKEIEERKKIWENLLGIEIPIFYTSALTGLNVEQIFADLLTDIL